MENNVREEVLNKELLEKVPVSLNLGRKNIEKRIYVVRVRKTIQKIRR